MYAWEAYELTASPTGQLSKTTCLYYQIIVFLSIYFIFKFTFCHLFIALILTSSSYSDFNSPGSDTMNSSYSILSTSSASMFCWGSFTALIYPFLNLNLIIVPFLDSLTVILFSNKYLFNLDKLSVFSLFIEISL